MIVGGGSPRLCRRAALLHVFALFPGRRALFYDCQVRLRIAVLQEFLHADRRKGCHDGGISPLSRKSIGCAASHPAAPRKPDNYRRDRASGCALQQTAQAIFLEGLKALAWYFLSPDMFRSEATDTRMGSGSAWEVSPILTELSRSLLGFVLGSAFCRTRQGPVPHRPKRSLSRHPKKSYDPGGSPSTSKGCRSCLRKP